MKLEDIRTSNVMRLAVLTSGLVAGALLAERQSPAQQETTEPQQQNPQVFRPILRDDFKPLGNDSYELSFQNTQTKLFIYPDTGFELFHVTPRGLIPFAPPQPGGMVNGYNNIWLQVKSFYKNEYDPNISESARLNNLNGEKGRFNFLVQTLLRDRNFQWQQDFGNSHYRYHGRPSGPGGV